MKGRRGKRCKQLLDDSKESRECCDMKKEAPDRTVGNSLWQRLWTCRKMNCVMEINLAYKFGGFKFELMSASILMTDVSVNYDM